MQATGVGRLESMYLHKLLARNILKFTCKLCRCKNQFEIFIKKLEKCQLVFFLGRLQKLSCEKPPIASIFAASRRN